VINVDYKPIDDDELLTDLLAKSVNKGYTLTNRNNIKTVKTLSNQGFSQLQPTSTNPFHPIDRVEVAGSRPVRVTIHNVKKPLNNEVPP
jgi:hypothetical protein